VAIIGRWLTDTMDERDLELGYWMHQDQ